MTVHIFKGTNKASVAKPVKQAAAESDARQHTCSCTWQASLNALAYDNSIRELALVTVYQRNFTVSRLKPAISQPGSIVKQCQSLLKQKATRQPVSTRTRLESSSRLQLMQAKREHRSQRQELHAHHTARSCDHGLFPDSHCLSTISRYGAPPHSLVKACNKY